MERELPTINVGGTDFLVDVLTAELREKTNPKNVMRVELMQYGGKFGYSFYYDLNKKNYPDNDRIIELGSDNDIVYVEIPELKNLDPRGLAEKYSVSLEAVKAKSDFELAIKPGSLHDLRLNRGMLPTVDIAGHTFYVDLQMDKLRPKDDFMSEGIKFSEIQDYYDRDRRAYVIPYNPTTHEFQQDDVFAMTDLPKDTIVVQFPHQSELDMVGWDRKHNDGISSQYVEQMHFEARTLPWIETDIIEHIKRNVAEQLQPKEEYTENKPNDSLYRIPSDTQRILPTYQILGTEFIVDVNQLKILEKENPKNEISISEMDEQEGQGYTFWYSPERRSLTTYAEQGAKLAEIPDFVELDPIGMAKKHQISEDKIREMTDFKLMVNQEVFDKIANSAILPTIDIAGDTFYIDVLNDKLHFKDDIWSRGIIFSELKNYYSPRENVFTIPYNQRTHTFQEISLNEKEIPRDIIIVQIPGKRALDPIRKNKSGNINKSDYLKKMGVHLHFEAKIIPWHHTLLAETIQRNNAQKASKAEKPPIKPKIHEGKSVSKRKGRRI